MSHRQLYENMIENPTCRNCRLWSALSRPQMQAVFDEVNGVIKKYRYMVTFTIDPKRHALNNETYDKVEKYIIKQLKSKAKSIETCYLVREGGDDEHKHVHWHTVFEALVPCDSSRFDYYEKLYGNFYFEPTKTQNLDSGMKYISKQLQPTLLISPLN